MPLQDDILREVQAGRLAETWTSSDLLKNDFLRGEYEQATLQSDPPNRSVSLPNLNLGDGNSVREGKAAALYYRVGKRGRALLYSLIPLAMLENDSGSGSSSPDQVAENQMAVQPSSKQSGISGEGAWNVNLPFVSGFVDWVVAKEKSGSFDFKYKLHGNNLSAKSIESSAVQYNWKSGVIPTELISHISGFPSSESNLTSTVNLLVKLRGELKRSLSARDALGHWKACWATLHWGGVAFASNLEFYALRYIRAVGRQPDGLIDYHEAAHKAGWFDPTVTSENRLLANINGMSAGITKIHSLIADDLLIYDSRVACAFAWLVDRYCDSLCKIVVPKELHFSLPAPRKGEQVVRDPESVRSALKSRLTTKYKRVTPNTTIATNDVKHWTRDMFRTSLILSEILKKLGRVSTNDDGVEVVDPKAFLEYQLGLFMIGYHLEHHRV